MPRTFANILGRFDDRANPYMVKELRQAVNNRFMLIILGGFLLWQPVSLLLGYDGSSRDPGMGIVLMQFAGLMAFAFLGVPVYIGSVCAGEKSLSCNMLYGTVMDATSVVFGKVKAGLCLVLLAMSITLPCMFGMSIFRGVDMMGMIWVAVMLVIYSTMNISNGIFLGLIRRRPVLFGFFTFCYLIFLPIEMTCFVGTADSLISGAGPASVVLTMILTGGIVILIDAVLIGLASVAVEPIMWG